ncbi:hypothetical protein, partial [Rubripirellula obstinata]|uniref:hypothetical protein n=1 Tax=Rubripirellula obstinata TaxID=406547 RepID=UPI001EE429A7
ITIACTGVAAAHFPLCLHVKSRHLGDAYRYPTEIRSVNTIATNPYAPPPEHAVPDADSTTSIRTRVSRPATALIVMASIQSVFVAIYLVSAAVVVARGGSVSHDYVGLAIATIQLTGLVLISIGGAKLGFLESLTLARLGASLACIPFITPFVFVGIPFGVWSLRLLADPSVRAAFPDHSVQPNEGG